MPDATSRDDSLDINLPNYRIDDVIQAARSGAAVTIGAEEPAADGIQQIPVVIPVRETPAAADARDKLLAAIGAEAQQVVEKSAGQASTALAELARAYALVTAGATLTTGSTSVSG